MRSLIDFAEERKRKPNTISAYISRYKEEFAGHTFMDGKHMMLDNHALAILDEQYPKPEVKEDFETIKALAAAREEVIKLQEQIIQNADVVAQAKTTLLLIGVKDDRINELQAEIEEEQKLRATANQKIETQQQEIQDLKDQLAAEKAKKWYQKLFGN